MVQRIALGLVAGLIAAVSLRAFAAELDGSGLPKQFRPWRAVGAIAPPERGDRAGAGDVFALVGRSGAGKSTVLKLINRLLEQQSGEVFVQQRDTRAWEPIELRRRVGYVLQEVGLFPHMTVGDNVGVVSRLEEWDAQRTSARVVTTPAPGFSSGTMREILPSAVRAGMAMIGQPPRERDAPRMKSVWPPKPL